MSDKKKIVGIVVLLVIIIAIIAVVWYQHLTNNGGTSGNSGSINTSSTLPAVQASSTRGPTPVGSVAPDKGTTSSTPAGVAVPTVQAPGNPSGSVSYRSFNISIQNGAYNPSTVIVNLGDTVNLELTAVDAAYGFDQPDYDFNAAIPKGKTQTIQFQALSPGSFTFYCASCGGPSSGPVGHIIVVPKQ